jgi:acylglycerol lipase
MSPDTKSTPAAFLVISASALHGIANKASLPVSSRMIHAMAGSTDKALKLYDGHVRDLLADISKKTVPSDMVTWI